MSSPIKQLKAPKTPEELEVLKARHDEITPAYKAASMAQLEAWLVGDFTHNTLPCSCGVVDEDGKIVNYIEFDEEECCPDFSCCGCPPWPVEQRQVFIDKIKAGEDIATMLFGGLTAAVQLSDVDPDKIYLTAADNAPPEGNTIH